MAETIYTIPINDAFSKNDSCPLCTIMNDLCEGEIDAILGAAKMEPDTRIETNKLGFCAEHFGMLLSKSQKLSVALMLESHLAEIEKHLFSGALFHSPEKDADYLEKLSESCYICSRLQKHTKRIYDNIFYLYSSDPDFTNKLKNQKSYCLPHYKELIKYAGVFLSKKKYSDFCDIIKTTEKEYLNSLAGELEFFCSKFDYRNAGGSFGSSKDSPERTIYAITGKKF